MPFFTLCFFGTSARSGNPRGLSGEPLHVRGSTGSTSTIENSRFEYNYIGVSAYYGPASVSVRNSVFANNLIGVYAFTSSTTRPVMILVDTCTIAHNTAGTQAQVDVAGSATIRVTNSTIYHNASGMAVGGGGTIESYGNNRVTANTNGSTFSGTVLPLQ